MDANNLYGYAMSMSLQTCRFKWIDPKEFHMNKYTYNGSEGCVLDLKYPKELRKLELIFWQIKYVLHYDNLQLYLRRGLKLKIRFIKIQSIAMAKTVRRI